jgi:hypothetical protein
LRCCAGPPHKVGYRSGTLAARLQESRLARGEEEATPPEEWIAMLALVEGHPNVDVIIFYIFAAAILTLLLYRHHRKTS